MSSLYFEISSSKLSCLKLSARGSQPGSCKSEKYIFHQRQLSQSKLLTVASLCGRHKDTLLLAWQNNNLLKSFHEAIEMCCQRHFCFGRPTVRSIPSLVAGNLQLYLFCIKVQCTVCSSLKLVFFCQEQTRTQSQPKHKRETRHKRTKNHLLGLPVYGAIVWKFLIKWSIIILFKCQEHSISRPHWNTETRAKLQTIYIAALERNSSGLKTEIRTGPELSSWVGGRRWWSCTTTVCIYCLLHLSAPNAICSLGIWVKLQ